MTTGFQIYVMCVFLYFLHNLSFTGLFLDYYSARSKASAEYWIHFTARFGGVHAFGYLYRPNFAESEPIYG